MYTYKQTNTHTMKVHMCMCNMSSCVVIIRRGSGQAFAAPRLNARVSSGPSGPSGPPGRDLYSGQDKST